LSITPKTPKHGVKEKNVLFSPQVAAEDAERSYFSNRKVQHFFPGKREYTVKAFNHCIDLK